LQWQTQVQLLAMKAPEHPTSQMRHGVNYFIAAKCSEQAQLIQYTTIAEDLASSSHDK